jgi:acyl-CoA dehydrogenase
LAADVAMLALGGYLKKKENLSARLGDVLSYMYLASMVLKHHDNQGREEADLPLVEWACRSLLYQAQEQLHLFSAQFPQSSAGGLMRCSFSRAGSPIFRRAIGWAATSRA